MGMIPTVIETSGRGERAFDIYSRLLKDRIVFVSGELTDQLADLVVAQLLYLQSEDPERAINLYVNSPGGSLRAAFSIYDTMQLVQPQVATFCTGLAASGGSAILCAGAKGRRYALPHAKIHVHQPWVGGIQGQATDIEIHAKEIIDVRRRLDQILAKHTGQDLEKVARDTERDYFMSADEAKEYNLIDRVISHH